MRDPETTQMLAQLDEVRRLTIAFDGGDPEQPPRTRKRKPSLAGVARQAAKAGVEVSRYDVRPDGTISVVPGKPTETTTDNNNDKDDNEWDGVLQ
jgi:hypothetical protein